MKKVGYNIGSREDKDYAPAKVVCIASDEAYNDIKDILSSKNSKYEVTPHIMYDKNGDWIVIVTSKRKRAK